MTHIKSAYDRWAATYDTDRNITRDLDAEVTRKVLGDRTFQTIVEFGCGTGKNSGFFTTIAEQVWCVDFSEEMIAIAKTAVEATKVQFVVSSIASAWPFESRFADLVSCNLVLQHVEDLHFVFSEGYRVLDSNGVMFVSELHPIKKYQGSMARYSLGGEEVIIPSYNHHISHYISAATQQGFLLEGIDESWHEEDIGKQPRLVTFAFRKPRLKGPVHQ